MGSDSHQTVPSDGNVNADLLEALAAAAHEVFCDGLRSRGYTFAAVTDDDRQTSSKLRPYAALDEEDKEQARGNVRDIADKLTFAGYMMVPARGEEERVPLAEAVVESLAEMEHVRWMQAQLAAGWEHGAPTDVPNKRHEGLLPWAELPEYQRVKDRDMVAGIPRILARAGYAIVPAGDSAGEAGTVEA